ncbi:GDSL-type esterase/lipase family protein [Streptomyces sp. NBC_00006]|uniref:GDSL-type esterase/lipase family protein n=1 Tax=Streptomyces sp. NBC_00006 TaxID=2975619 RepID=UPI0022566D0A|nr:GDSL-type esterase/lipase family protein [Streptomyces sp. NBC_00006]MCX5535284.1 GDSL-type esterase/lipase family protein [Streptomyces sp. NBC_00006]
METVIDADPRERWNAAPAVYILGDSVAKMVAPKRRDRAGWGEELERLFADEVRVYNFSKKDWSILSAAETFLPSVLNTLRPGDIVLIAYGHVDQQLHRHDRYVAPADFCHVLGRMARQVRDRGGVPVLVTQATRAGFYEDGTVIDATGGYADLVRETAAAHEVPVLDLSELTARLFRSLGPRETRLYFNWFAAGELQELPDGQIDTSNFNRAGCARIAVLMAEELKAQGLVDARWFLLPAPVPPPLPGRPEWDTAQIEAELARRAVVPELPVEVSFQDPAPGAVVLPRRVFRGTAGQGVRHIVFFSDGRPVGETSVGPQGTWLWRLAYYWPPGLHTLTAVGLTDKAATTPVELPLRVIASIEAPTVTHPLPGRVVPGTPVIAGVARNASKAVFLHHGRRIGETKVDDGGRWSFTPSEPWPAGRHTVRVVACHGMVISPPADWEIEVVDAVAPPAELPGTDTLPTEVHGWRPALRSDR